MEFTPGSIGYVAWAGEALAELMPDGSWVVRYQGVPSPSGATQVAAIMREVPDGPEWGDPASAILEFLADFMGGTWMRHDAPLGPTPGIVH